MLQRLVACHSFARVGCEAAFYEFTRDLGDAAPVFERREGVVGDEDGLHFFEVGVAVEGCVAAEEEVGYYADGPDVSEGRGLVWDGDLGGFWGRGAYTGFPCPVFLKISGAM